MDRGDPEYPSFQVYLIGGEVISLRALVLENLQAAHEITHIQFMKNPDTLKIAVALMVAGIGLQRATAASLTGGISITASVSLNAPTATATGVTSFTGGVTFSPSGSYLGTAGDSVSLSGFIFSPALSPNPVTLWTYTDVGLSKTFSFKATGLTSVSHSSSFGTDFLTIHGTGIASGTGYTDTPASFMLVFSGGRANGSIVPNPVPEPTTYAMVAGLGLAGFGVWRRSTRR
jgi:hypothetical protein